MFSSVQGGVFIVARAVHLLSVASFLGAVTSAAVVKIRAERGGDRLEVLYALRACRTIAKYITGPSAGVLTLTGFIMVWRIGWALLGHTWLQLLLVVWAGTAATAVAVLDPNLQALEVRVTRSTMRLDAEYWRRSRRWNVVALGLLACNVISFALAVFRPA